MKPLVTRHRAHGTKRWGVARVRRRQSKKRQLMSVETLNENISGVMHNLKSALMALDGYLDLLGKDGSDEIYEQAKRSTTTAETIIGKVKFELELGEEDSIYRVPAKIMGRLDVFITDVGIGGTLIVVQYIHNSINSLHIVDRWQKSL